jgi:hypothetical protein
MLYNLRYLKLLLMKNCLFPLILFCEIDFVYSLPLPTPSKLLVTRKFEEFEKTTIEQFECALIDFIHMALVINAFVISKFVDHTVFVMPQNYSPKDFVKSIDEYYRSGKIKNISILLNDIYKSGLGYGYLQGYDYNYGYCSKKKGGGRYYEEN